MEPRRKRRLAVMNELRCVTCEEQRFFSNFIKDLLSGLEPDSALSAEKFKKQIRGVRSAECRMGKGGERPREASVRRTVWRLAGTSPHRTNTSRLAPAVAAQLDQIRFTAHMCFRARGLVCCHAGSRLRRKRFMKRSLKFRHLKRYKDIGLLALRYGDSDTVHDIGVDDVLKDGQMANGDPSTPDELANELERMGPTFVKLGQVLSSRVDLLPERYIKALSRLQDKVKPFPYSEVEEIITQELGVRISKAFACFEHEPIAAASLGQVHAARLRDGRAVVVKVQRPGIRKQIAEDLEVLEELASFLERHTRAGKRYQFLRVLEEFRHTLLQEFDYQREASNLTTLATNLKDFGGIKVPLPVKNYTTRHVLTMERIEGAKITEIGPLVRL